MKLKDRAKTYSFWVSLASAIILIIKLIGQKYGLNIDENFISDLVTTICGLLVILGIIVVPKTDISSTRQVTSVINENISNKAITDTTIVQEIVNDDESEQLNEVENKINETLSLENYEDTSNLVSTSENIETMQEFNEDNLDENTQDTTIQLQTNNSIEEIKNQVNNLLLKEKELNLDNFKAIKQIFIDEINKLND